MAKATIFNSLLALGAISANFFKTGDVVITKNGVIGKIISIDNLALGDMICIDSTLPIKHLNPNEFTLVQTDIKKWFDKGYEDGEMRWHNQDFEEIKLPIEFNLDYNSDYRLGYLQAMKDLNNINKDWEEFYYSSVADLNIDGFYSEE